MRLRLSRIGIYMLVKGLLMVLAALAVLAAVVALADFVELSRTVGAAEVGYVEVLRLTALNLPSRLLLILPFAILFGVLGAFVDLNRNSELVAMRAAGISAWRFILPTAGAAFFIGLLTMTVLNPVASILDAQFERERAARDEGFAPNGSKDIWLRQADARTQLIVRARSGESDHGVLRLRDVSMFMFTKSGNGGAQLSRRVEAAQGWLLRGRWLLANVREATPGGVTLRDDTLTILSSVDPTTALERYASPSATAFWQLWGTIGRTERAGFSATGYRLQLQELLATPLLFVAMSNLAAVFSLRLTRLGGVVGRAGIGVALAFGIFFFTQACSALGEAGLVPPFVAAWTPPVLALLFGFTILCYTEDG